MILYDLCLMPAKYYNNIIPIRHFESHMQIVGQCVLWKFVSGAENLILQALQFQYIGICPKLPPLGGMSL